MNEATKPSKMDEALMLLSHRADAQHALRTERRHRSRRRIAFCVSVLAPSSRRLSRWAALCSGFRRRLRVPPRPAGTWCQVWCMAQRSCTGALTTRYASSWATRTLPTQPHSSGFAFKYYPFTVSEDLRIAPYLPALCLECLCAGGAVRAFGKSCLARHRARRQRRSSSPTRSATCAYTRCPAFAGGGT